MGDCRSLVRYNILPNRTIPVEAETKTMKLVSYTVLLLLIATAVNTQAQQPRSAAERAEQLRRQLIELQAEEETLRARAAQLDEALKPENIERSLAGVGSTRPEELRETRRKQLQIERDGIAAQLNILESNRARLEAAIRDADARAYQQSPREVPSSDLLVTQSTWRPRWLISGGVGGAIGVAFLVTSLFVRRRLRRRSGH